MSEPRECPDGHGPLFVVESMDFMGGEATVYRCETCGYMLGVLVHPRLTEQIMFEAKKPE